MTLYFLQRYEDLQSKIKYQNKATYLHNIHEVVFRTVISSQVQLRSVAYILWGKTITIHVIKYKKLIKSVFQFSISCTIQFSIKFYLLIRWTSKYDYGSEYWSTTAHYFVFSNIMSWSKSWPFVYYTITISTIHNSFRLFIKGELPNTNKEKTFLKKKIHDHIISFYLI
jgi:hypothetical protein